MSRNPLKKKKIGKTGVGVIVVTAVFAVLGTVFLIIGYHDVVLTWMRTSGVAFLVMALFPLGFIVYHLIDKRIQP